MAMIRAGSHQFFVVGAIGAVADVIIDPNEDAPNFPFLTTVADNDPSNDLANLPLAPLAIDHVQEVPS